MSLFKPYTAKSEQPAVTEFDILKASHRFLRDDAEGSTSWNDQLAKKYYDSLYREFAICDLKHYKSGNVRRLPFVGAQNRRFSAELEKHLAQIPEHGEHKEALVKIVLCPKCVRKLMWKRRHDKRDNKEKGERKTGDAEPVLAEESERRRRSRSQSPPRRAR